MPVTNWPPFSIGWITLDSASQLLATTAEQKLAAVCQQLTPIPSSFLSHFRIRGIFGGIFRRNFGRNSAAIFKAFFFDFWRGRVAPRQKSEKMPSFTAEPATHSAEPATHSAEIPSNFCKKQKFRKVLS